MDKAWQKNFFFQVEFFFFFAHLLQLPRKTSFQRWHIWVVFKLRCQYFKNKKSQRPGALKVFRLPFIHRKQKWVILKPRNYSQHVKCCPHLTCAVYASTVMCNYFFIKKYCWSSVITFLILIMTALKPNCHITQNEVLALRAAIHYVPLTTQTAEKQKGNSALVSIRLPRIDSLSRWPVSLTDWLRWFTVGKNRNGVFFHWVLCVSVMGFSAVLHMVVVRLHNELLLVFKKAGVFCRRRSILVHFLLLDIWCTCRSQNVNINIFFFFAQVWLFTIVVQCKYQTFPHLHCGHSS